MTMWGTIMSSSRTAEPALQILLHVLSAWPVDSVYTSDGDSTGVFALAATMTLWRVFNLTWCPPVVLEYFPSLFLRLLFQAYISTLDISEEVDTFWKALWQLFDNDNSLVQLLSVRLFQELMKLVVAKGKKPLKKRVSKSLLPLFFNCHDENQRVAQASRETLLSAVKFLKRRDLQHLVKTDQMWSFAECLLAEDRSRAAEHLRLALPYLQSPQEPLREAAVRFIGLAGRYLRGKQQEFWIICRALQDMMDDISPAISCLALQTLYINLAVQSIPSSRPRDMHDQLRRLWRSWPFLRRCGWLSCCSAVEN
ncbi:uncharacterized protein LOC128790906 [Vidua chalybeata]|uniref:uncharacterized protein LOC128790858 n=1 Tax=Vidua chalybeata TaxID=81927 RepID=UPI0023A87CC7|nr:uncharacterized protein LOC128790858 [Vidua chalybeata]XP_053804075.1 uncharacterized protein LOC128790906 [Vidua chalybeata]